MRALAAATALFACLAWADIPPKDSQSCRDAKAGAKCKTDEHKAGTCVKSTCSRNDYSEGPPPKLVAVECLVCVTSTPDAGVKK
jgi:hypothetical protein